MSSFRWCEAQRLHDLEIGRHRVEAFGFAVISVAAPALVRSGIRCRRGAGRAPEDAGPGLRQAGSRTFQLPAACPKTHPKPLSLWSCF